MRKRIYVLIWKTDLDVTGVDGYWNRPLTEEEQHGYFKEHYPAAYEDEGKCCISWEMVELKGRKQPAPLPNWGWSGKHYKDPWE